MRWRGARIGIDKDRPTRLELLMAFFNARDLFPDSKIDTSKTGKGYHIRIYHQSSIEQNIAVRRHLGDDPQRIAFDEVRSRIPALHSWVDTLFERKIKDGKMTCEEPCNVLSEQFYGFRAPCRKKGALR